MTFSSVFCDHIFRFKEMRNLFQTCIFQFIHSLYMNNFTEFKKFPRLQYHYIFPSYYILLWTRLTLNLRGPTTFEDMIFYLWTDSKEMCTAMASLSYGRIFCLEFQKIDGTYQRYNHYFEFFLLEFYFFFT